MYDKIMEDYTDHVSEKKKELIHYVLEAMDDAVESVITNFDDIDDYDIACYYQALDENAILPAFQHNTDACMDIYAIKDQTIPAQAYGVLVPTGFALAIPEGYKISIFARSGMSMKTMLRLSNGVGQIDAGYRDEVKILFDNIGHESYQIHKGDRIAQMAFEPVFKVPMKQIDDVKAVGTDRNGGFGSTGA
jgi:dUTP pyrophosphatase